jgi:hypothetical protein
MPVSKIHIIRLSCGAFHERVPATRIHGIDIAANLSALAFSAPLFVMNQRNPKYNFIAPVKAK